ncbi:hypothetical protein V1639_13975 [Pseudarthrobacter sp. J75]|uniref:hypothetical protein n=1 Tax=unclassified Pseudarthrobacter TaxID=2647000 RepID=UPI002E80BE8C|nr:MULTISPECIES: hypothetical protein [unclassified Pseudarthrobacter]MEE2524612.1 hypothetical protein [Pseudarthrobacter sp. J47]MEE2530129.1 hypothetical protein [Pseudarthrobacter sp. J75]MEE2570422.1 hypothetical protein [Pseudarthrobacter sp. J64]
MQFDVTALEPATLVFIGTMIFAFVLAAFVMAAAFVALVFVGIGKLIWTIVVAILMALVHGINHLWDRLVHHASKVELPSDLHGQSGSGTGSYSRVALKDS